MADLSKAVYTFLAADSNITAQVSTRIYRDRLPQGATLPAIVYTLVTGTVEHHMENAADLSNDVYQIDIWASTRSSANSIGELVRLRLDGYYGAFGSEQVGGVLLQSTQHISEEPVDDSDTWLHRQISDYSIWYVSAVPSR